MITKKELARSRIESFLYGPGGLLEILEAKASNEHPIYSGFVIEALMAIIDGEDPATAFGMNEKKGRPSTEDRDVMIAREYAELTATPGNSAAAIQQLSERWAACGVGRASIEKICKGETREAGGKKYLLYLQIQRDAPEAHKMLIEADRRLFESLRVKK